MSGAPRARIFRPRALFLLATSQMLRRQTQGHDNNHFDLSKTIQLLFFFSGLDS